MAVFKCKMCGGDLDVIEVGNICECLYCGTVQTIPSDTDEKKVHQFNRANSLRSRNDFDAAAAVYEAVVSEFPDEAEAYWGLCLCRYGIEYVEDPATHKMKPTCHRTEFESILDDSDYKQALDRANSSSRHFYQEEAEEIDRLQKEILTLVKEETPYDVFICYKETDERGERTADSVIAQDIYDALTEKGYKVFFARITLEDKLGAAYEPCIFSALHTARIMLVIGTRPEYFGAVWVKNEWSRYLKMMSRDKSKFLFPCYAEMDAYDIPKEIRNLQAQDLGKIGAVQDLVRNIGKVIPIEAPAQPAPARSGPNVENLLKRGFIKLEEMSWDEAKGFFERVLDENAEEGRAYLGLLMAEFKVAERGKLTALAEKIRERPNYRNAVRYGDRALKAEMESYVRAYEEEQRRIIERREEEVRRKAEEERTRREKAQLYSQVIGCISAFAKEKRRQEEARAREETYAAAEKYESEGEYLDALKTYSKVSGYKDSKTKCGEMRRELCALNSKRFAGGYNCSIGITESGAAFSGVKRLRELAAEWRDIAAVSAGLVHTVALKENGTVSSIGDNDVGQLDTEDWYDIKEIACGNHITGGLRTDGTAVAAGCGEDCSGDVSEWRDIRKIACGKYMVVGVRNDGTVVITGGPKECEDWTDIADVRCDKHIVGLKKDGTVLAAGDNKYGQCSVSDWQDIVLVRCCNEHTVGVRADGTAVAVGNNEFGQCDVSGWSDIIDVFCGAEHTVGLKADGTVVAVGNNKDGRCNVSGWKNIIAIAGSWRHTIGLTADGRAVAAGEDNAYYCDLSYWQRLKVIGSRSEAEAAAEKQRAATAAYTGETGAKKARRDQKYQSALAAEKRGDNYSAIKLLTDPELSGYRDSAERARELWKPLLKYNMGAIAGDFTIFALRNDGRVTPVNGSRGALENEVMSWSGIASISGKRTIVGIDRAGNAYAAGGKLNLKKFSGIVSCAAEGDLAVGVKADGTVVQTKDNNTSSWADIVDIAIGAKDVGSKNYVVGLRKDGSLACSTKYRAPALSDITAFALGERHAVGLRADGTVVGTEYGSAVNVNSSAVKKANDVENWKDIVAVACGSSHTVGLRADGTVTAAGSNDTEQCEVSEWTDVVAIACGHGSTIGLRADGTILAAGYPQSSYSAENIRVVLSDPPTAGSAFGSAGAAPAAAPAPTRVSAQIAAPAPAPARVTATIAAPPPAPAYTAPPPAAPVYTAPPTSAPVYAAAPPSAPVYTAPSAPAPNAAALIQLLKAKYEACQLLAETKPSAFNKGKRERYKQTISDANNNRAALGPAGSAAELEGMVTAYEQNTLILIDDKNPMNILRHSEAKSELVRFRLSIDQWLSAHQV